MTTQLRPPFARICRHSLTHIFYPWWLLPVAVVAVLLPLNIAGKIELDKTLPEFLALALLFLAVIICIQRWRRLRADFLLWLSILLVIFLCRELHFEGSAALVYLGFPTLMIIAWRRYASLGSYLGSRRFLNLFSTAIVSYLIAVGMDNHWWKFLPGDKYQWAGVEEYVELTGHLMLLLLAASCKAAPNALLNHGKETDQSV